MKSNIAEYIILHFRISYKYICKIRSLIIMFITKTCKLLT